MTRIIPYELIKHLEWDPDKQDSQKQETPQPLPQQSTFTVESLINHGKEFFSDAKDEENRSIGLATALQEAVDYVGNEGIIASMPYLIAGKAQADSESYLWQRYFDVLSEEHVGIDKNGVFVERGKPVVITLHGKGILTPTRIMMAYNEGLTEQRTARLTEEEFYNLLNGNIPSGEQINIYTLEDIKSNNISNPFGNYAVILDHEIAKTTNSGLHKKTDFMKNPLIFARAGTLDYLDDYFDKAKDSDGEVGNWHRLNEIDPNQQQGRLLYLYNDFDGLDGHDGLDDSGRFVGVAPEAQDE